MYKTYIPPIKSQGIKTKLVPWISSIIPASFKGRWIEPFMGTGVVAFNIAPKEAVLSDSNPHLIAFYRAIQKKEITPSIVREFLNEEGNALLKKGEAHYYEIRERFNNFKDPLDFLFLNRSCFNGMIRFNKRGGFNVPFCRKPQRFAQVYITKIVNQVKYVYDLFQFNQFEFVCQDFKDTIKISELLLSDDHDLIHKAVGWMLREIGKRDKFELKKFLDKYYKKISRTTLRYSIERLEEKERQEYLKRKN